MKKEIAIACAFALLLNAVKAGNETILYEGNLLPENITPGLTPEDTEKGTISLDSGIIRLENSNVLDEIGYGLDTDRGTEDEFAFTFSSRALNSAETPNSSGFALFAWGAVFDAVGTRLFFENDNFTWQINSNGEERSFTIDDDVFHTYTIFKFSGQTSVKLALDGIVVSSADISLFGTDHFAPQIYFGNQADSITEWDFVRVHMGEGALDIVSAVVPEVNYFGLPLFACFLAICRRRLIG